MTTQSQGLRDWMRKIEADVERMEDKLEKSVEGIQRTIRAEIVELKAESIADLRRRMDDGYRTLEKFDERLRASENSIRDWKVGSGVVGWIVKTAIAVLGVIAGAFGWEHLRH